MHVKNKEAFPADISFCYPWRKYQERILGELDEHLMNKHLHLVAPPGSGKTVLGLEVMLRLNKPTIILAPTLTIKNQWEQRFTELFLQIDNKPDWVSMHIKKPAFVTITTYQALFSLYRAHEEQLEEVTLEETEGEKEVIHQSEIDIIFSQLDALQFQTIILDEAHHLRTAWWKATMAFRDRLHDYATVALTATPPYDVSFQEWEKYEQLCGPIDAEIHVGELVREGDLCPHQDYIYLSEPDKEEKKRLRYYHDDVEDLVADLLENASLDRAISEHPWIKQLNEHTDSILSDPAYFSSFILYLHQIDVEIHKDALKLLAIKKGKIPAFTLDWAEILLNGMRKDTYFEEQDIINMDELEHTLKKIGALERGVVYLHSTPTTDKQMMQSTSKFDSIEKIVNMENRYLGDDLRMVILTDYIRKEMLEHKSAANRLGVVPIFQQIHRSLGSFFPVAVLTGSLVIIPQSIQPYLEGLAKERDISITCTPVSLYESFVRVQVTQQNRAHIVAMMTELFTEGHIRILVGTAALLGEGWDAPCINSLIMASYVGSFMLSNQMRGRAIRSDHNNPNKTSGIWHLACVDTTQDYGGFDMISLRRRFRSLVGIDAELDFISTGLSRAGDYVNFRFSTRTIQNLNKDTFERASNREQLKERWQKAVSDREGKQEVQLRAEPIISVKPFVQMNTIKALLFGLLYVVTPFLLEGVQIAFREQNLEVIRFVLITFIIMAIIVSIPTLWKVLRLALRYRSLDKYMKEVGEILYDSMYALGHVKTKPKDMLIDVEDVEGILICKIRGGKMVEKNLIMAAWSELLAPIENPRYILRREPQKLLGFKRKPDYLAVPEEIGKRKEDAALFCEKWNKQLEEASLHYTRTPEGRSMLIRARFEAISANYTEKPEQVTVWK